MFMNSCHDCSSLLRQAVFSVSEDRKTKKHFTMKDDELQTIVLLPDAG